MNISEVTVRSRAAGTAAGKTSSKKEWKLTDSLREKIIEYAKSDAAQNVYMGNRFLALRKSEVAKVAPDRAALIGKINMAMCSGDMSYQKRIEEADRRWLRILFGEPYEAEVQSEGTGSAIHVYDENGDEILTYTAGVGWHEKESKAETKVHGAIKSVYYKAYCEARKEINAAAGQQDYSYSLYSRESVRQAQPDVAAAAMESQGGFEARA